MIKIVKITIQNIEKNNGVTLFLDYKNSNNCEYQGFEPLGDLNEAIEKASNMIEGEVSEGFVCTATTIEVKTFKADGTKTTEEVAPVTRKESLVNRLSKTNFINIFGEDLGTHFYRKFGFQLENIGGAFKDRFNTFYGKLDLQQQRVLTKFQNS